MNLFNYFFKKKLSSEEETRDKEYLVVFFRDGPANRFFLYHTATYLAKLWNKIFVYDPTIQKQKGAVHDPTFDIQNFFSCERRYVTDIDTIISQYDDYEIVNYNWKEKLLSMKRPEGNVLLTNGWYQTFWEGHMTIPNLPIVKLPFNSEEAFFIHVRRGDYVKSRIFQNLNDYYLRAYGMMSKKFPQARCIIFSDDVPWCKSHFTYIEKPIYIEGLDYKESLYIMSKCKLGCILSNSTFGLWGAYIAQFNTPNFVTIAPKPWLPEEDQNIGVNNYIIPPWVKCLDVDS